MFAGGHPGRAVSVLAAFGLLDSAISLPSPDYVPIAAAVGRRQANTAASVYETRFPNVTWDNENWILTTANLDQGHYQSRMSIANGYLGINVAAVGPFFE
ncbi:MAG: hypothetical protein Q9187_009568, partial [Circinaria calcarea]